MIKNLVKTRLPTGFGDFSLYLYAEAGKEHLALVKGEVRDFDFHLRRKDGASAALPLNVEIIDDGPGIPPEIAANIFEPFVSGRENGTGLGLALVSKIVSDHEGWITVDSAPGRTVFRVSLPMAPRERKEAK